MLHVCFKPDVFLLAVHVRLLIMNNRQEWWQIERVVMLNETFYALKDTFQWFLT